MADPLRKVRPDEPLEIRAPTWNAFIDAAEAHQRSRGPGAGGGPLPDPVYAAVHVRLQNPGSSVTTLEVHSVQAYGPALTDPSTSEAVRLAARSAPVFEGATPTSSTDQVCVTTEPIAGQGIGRAVASGVAVVRLLVNDASHTRAVPVALVTAYMETAEAGGYPLLWKSADVIADSDPEQVWAFVLLGPAGGGAASSDAAGDCTNVLLMAGADSCFHATTAAGTGPCSTFDDSQELDFSWDVGDEVYYSSTALSTPDGTVKNLKLWLDVTGEPRPALAFADDTFRFAYAECRDGVMVFKSRKELCADEGDEGETTQTCGDRPFEVLIECAACGEVLLACRPTPYPRKLCLTVAGAAKVCEADDFSIIDGTVTLTWVNHIPSSTFATGGDNSPPVDNTSTQGPGWYGVYENEACLDGIFYRYAVRVEYDATYSRFTVRVGYVAANNPFDSCLWHNAGAIAYASVPCEDAQTFPIVADFSTAATGSYGCNSCAISGTVTIDEQTAGECPGATEEEPDCDFGDDPLTVVISSGANAGTYTTSSATAGVRTVTIGGTDYTIVYDTDLEEWTAFPTVATTPVIAATSQSPCPILEVTFPGELFGTDDPVVVTPPGGGTGCTLLDSDQIATLSIPGAPDQDAGWELDEQSTGNTSPDGTVTGFGYAGPILRYVAVGGVMYAKYWSGGFASLAVSDPPDYTAPADASPVCDGADCYTVTWTDPTLLVLVGTAGPITLAVGPSCGPPAACDVVDAPGSLGETYAASGLTESGDLYATVTVSLSSLTTNGPLIAFRLPAGDVCFCAYDAGSGLWRMINGGGTVDTAAVSLPTDGTPFEMSMSRVGSTYTGTINGASVTATYVTDEINQVDVGGLDDASDAGDYSDMCVSSAP